MLKDGLPGASVTALVLGVHELGHILIARDAGVKFGIPYFVPSWQVITVFHQVFFDHQTIHQYFAAFFMFFLTIQQISLLARGNFVRDWLMDDFIELNWRDSFCSIDYHLCFCLKNMCSAKTRLLLLSEYCLVPVPCKGRVTRKYAKSWVCLRQDFCFSLIALSLS